MHTKESPATTEKLAGYELWMRYMDGPSIALYSMVREAHVLIHQNADVGRVRIRSSTEINTEADSLREPATQSGCWPAAPPLLVQIGGSFSHAPSSQRPFQTGKDETFRSARTRTPGGREVRARTEDGTQATRQCTAWIQQNGDRRRLGRIQPNEARSDMVGS